MGCHCCRVRMLILSSVTTRCSDCSAIPASLFLLPCSLPFNSPKTGRFIVNSQSCPLSAYSAECFHKILGYCIISRWQGIVICWQSHRKDTVVRRQNRTLQRPEVLYWLQAWNEKTSIFVWRPEITRNAFKFNHQHIHPGTLVRVCLVCTSHMATWTYRKCFARFLLCLAKSVFQKAQWIKVLIDKIFIAPQEVLFLLTWGWPFSLVFTWLLILPMLLLTKIPVMNVPVQSQGVHLELQASPGHELPAGSWPSCSFLHSFSQHVRSSSPYSRNSWKFLSKKCLEFHFRMSCLSSSIPDSSEGKLSVMWCSAIGFFKLSIREFP